MRRPRFLFSIGWSLLLMWALLFGTVVRTAYRFYNSYGTGTAKVLSVNSAQRDFSPQAQKERGKPMFVKVYDVEFSEGGKLVRSNVTAVSNDTHSKEQWLNTYAVGTEHRIVFRRAVPSVAAFVGPTDETFVIAAIAATGGLLFLAVGLIYVGKTKAI